MNRAILKRLEVLEERCRAPRGIVFQWIDEGGMLNLGMDRNGRLPEGAELVMPINTDTTCSLLLNSF